MGGGGYSNGMIPLTQLELIANGTNSDGYWEHRLAPGTAARWRALVADVFEHEGIRLYISSGWNGYRPMSAQISAKQKYGRNAAAPGYSSHGGSFEGRDSMAIDVANWGQLGAAKFFAYARKHGFTADYFNGKNGRPLEQWHIIDFAPWIVPAEANTEPDAKPTDADQEDTMRFIDGANIIIWPNGVANSYTLDDYTIIKQYVNYPNDPTWSTGRGNFERALWAAFDFSKNAYASAVAVAVKAAIDADDNADVQKVVAAVLAALPKTYTVTPG